MQLMPSSVIARLALSVVVCACSKTELDVIVRPLSSGAPSGTSLLEAGVAVPPSPSPGVTVTPPPLQSSSSPAPSRSGEAGATDSPDGSPSAPDASQLDAAVPGDAGVDLCPFGDVDLVNVFSFRLREDGRCLAAGQPTTSDGMGALYTRLTENCYERDAQWQMIQVPFGGVEVRNFFWGFYLEILNDRLEPGSDAVLVVPNAEPPQQFLFWEIPENYRSITPYQAVSRCLHSSYTGKAELSECILDTDNQQWMLTPYACAPAEAGALDAAAPPLDAAARSSAEAGAAADTSVAPESNAASEPNAAPSTSAEDTSAAAP